MHEDEGGTAENPVPPPPSANQRTTTVTERQPSWSSNDATTDPRTSKGGLLDRADSPSVRAPEIGGVLFAGYLGNIVLRTSAASLAATLLVVTMVAVLIGSGRVRRREPLFFLGLAAILAPWLVIRSDASLTLVTCSMILILLGVACGISLRGSAFDGRVRDLAGHVVSPVYEWLHGLAILGRFTSAATSDRTLAPLLRGVAVALPVLTVFGTLLASADDVFANVLLIGDLPDMFGHLVLSAIVAVMLLGFLSRAAHETSGSGDSVDLRKLGPLEVTMILGSLAALFAAFVVTQVVVAFGGASHVLETEGLTQAEHARSGFFQVLWVAGLSTSLVGGLRAVRVTNPERGSDRFVPLALSTLALTLVIAFISMSRLTLYVDSFGLTPLRFWALAGAGGIALLIMAYAVSVSGWREDSSWFPGVALVLSALFVFGLNGVNPDAWIASHNVNRATGEVDTSVLQDLSDDGVTTALNLRGELNEQDRNALVGSLCGRSGRVTEFGFLGYNHAKASAEDALEPLC